jgi:ribosome-associated protein
MIKFELKNEYIALCDLLKAEGIADSGGQAKIMVANGNVKVDGKTELRKTAKIRKGQKVECLGHIIKIGSADQTN